MKSIGSLRFSSSQSLKSGRRRWWQSKAGRLSRRLTTCWNRELQHQDLQMVDLSVRDGASETIQHSPKRDSFRERQKREQMRLRKQKDKKSDKNVKQCKEGEESFAEVHNEGFIFDEGKISDEGKNICKVVIGKETMSGVVFPESGLVVQEFNLPEVIGEVANPTLTYANDMMTRETDLLVFGKQELGLDVSTDSAVDVVNFDSNKWPLDEEDLTDISLKEESTEFVDSSDGPLDCDITQTKTIVENTKLQQEGESTIWIQKTDQETNATRSENDDDILKETEGEQEPTKEGHRLTLSENNLSKQNLRNERELSRTHFRPALQDNQSEEEINEPKKVELADNEISSKNMSLDTLNCVKWTTEWQITDVDSAEKPNNKDMELAGTKDGEVNVEVIQSSDIDFGEESEMTESERSSGIMLDEVVEEAEDSNEANVSFVSRVSPLTDSHLPDQI